EIDALVGLVERLLVLPLLVVDARSRFTAPVQRDVQAPTRRRLRAEDARVVPQGLVSDRDRVRVDLGAPGFANERDVIFPQELTGDLGRLLVEGHARKRLFVERGPRCAFEREMGA